MIICSDQENLETCAQLFSRFWCFAIPWTVVYLALLFMEFSRQEYWSGLLFPPPRDFPNPGMEPKSPEFSALQEDSLPAEPSSGKPKSPEAIALTRTELKFKSRCTSSRL